MRCRVCHCTDQFGCTAGCGWAETELCTLCAEVCAFVLALCAVVPLATATIAVALHPHVTDALEDGDDKRTTRAIHRLVGAGFLVRDAEKRYSVTSTPRVRTRILAFVRAHAPRAVLGSGQQPPRRGGRAPASTRRAA